MFTSLKKKHFLEQLPNTSNASHEQMNGTLKLET